MTSLVDKLFTLNAVLVYVVVALLVFAEDALFVGFVLPGETAAVLGGVIASQGKVHLCLMIVLVVAAAIIGDTVGYEIGRHLGPRILALRILDNADDASTTPKTSYAAAAGGPCSSAGSSPSSAPSCPPSQAPPACPTDVSSRSTPLAASSGAPDSWCSGSSLATPTRRLRSRSGALPHWWSSPSCWSPSRYGVSARIATKPPANPKVERSGGGSPGFSRGASPGGGHAQADVRRGFVCSPT